MQVRRVQIPNVLDPMHFSHCGELRKARARLPTLGRYTSMCKGALKQQLLNNSHSKAPRKQNMPSLVDARTVVMLVLNCHGNIKLLYRKLETVHI